MLVLALAASVVAHPTPHCAHDITSRTTGGVRNSGYTFNRAVPYAGVGGAREVAEHGRKLVGSTFSPIRIQLDYSAGATSALSSTLDTFLKDTLLPAAVAWIEHSLSVVPVTGTLKHARFCSSTYTTSNTCAQEGATPTCGVTSSGASYSVPTSLLDSLRTCTTCYTDPSTPCDGCSTAPAGAGADADFVLFVSAVETSSCAGGTLAYASACHRDQNDRPIFGEANFCPSALSASASAWEDQLSTAIHEILHALGFSSASWPLFRNADGTPMTPREDDGLPALVTATCHDGATRSNELQVSASTLEVTTARGTTVTRLVTPRVRAVARDIFGCATLTGAEIENQPTGAGCYGSHWEQRNFMNEVMAPISSHHAAYSALTLAALEDSGWYRANYSQTEPLLWGRGKGCDFVNQPCVSSAGVAQPGFCTTQGAGGCTPGHRARGYCDISTYSSSLASHFQYFTDATTGGGMQEADFCPHMSAYSNGECHASGNAPSTNYRAESYGADSSCFDTSLSEVIGGMQISAASGQGCYPTRCAGGVLEVSVTNSSGHTTWLACPSGGGSVAPPAESGIDGTITCPTIAALLCAPSACPGLVCDGTSDCVHGVCICGDAFGTTCQSLDPQPPATPPLSSPPPPPMQPPSPLLPPAPPLAAYRPVVTCAFTIAGSVDSFDESAFKTSLATTLGNGIEGRDISLTVVAASIRVNATIVTLSQSAASAAASTLSTTTVSALSTSLGVTIESVAAVATSVELVLASPPVPPPSPPPPSPMPPGEPPSPPPPKASLPIVPVVAGVVGVLSVCILAVFVYSCCRRRGKAVSPQTV